MRRMIRVAKKVFISVLTLSVFVLGGLWMTAQALQPTPFGPAHAPSPNAYADAVIQVYGADVWGMRGWFAIHTWIATKGRGAEHYDIYQVIGWRLRRTGTAVDISTGMPDRPWFRSEPILLHEVRGDDADKLIGAVQNAVRSYPFQGEYTMWPGPNSNSFIEWIALEVPGLGLQLPAKALGAQWMRDHHAQIKARLD